MTPRKFLASAPAQISNCQSRYYKFQSASKAIIRFLHEQLVETFSTERSVHVVLRVDGAEQKSRLFYMIWKGC